ncbi:MAG: serine/threonine protein kinase [Phycisphaerales bacterium]
MEWVLVILGLVIGVPLAVVAIVYMIVPVVKFVGLIFRNIFRFIAGMFTDALRLIGALVAALVFALISLMCVVFRRPSAGHFWEAVGDEFVAAGGCVYRLLIGNLVRLFGLQALTEGIEKRVPRVFEEAPASEEEAAQRSAARRGQFEGYQIVGTLHAGGSGGRLYVGRPEGAKAEALRREHPEPIGDVVIKSFSVHEGSSLPQIVRESRALEAARKLGLVLDYELTGERFFYVMRYVPGESLGIVTPKLHAVCGPEGLKGPELTRAISYVCDLVATLDGYHRHGLWHKDIKPDNIIVSGGSVQGQAGRAYLVDFGLITPLRSSMTLTTHGTEYFRDPEMVRQALRGVKVQEVDGVKFDVYGAGAVLFSVIENSFPAHGSLSQLTKGCPESIRWIVRRAMADYDKRYPTAELMLADLRTALRACEVGTATTLRPADLPSLSGEPAPTPPSGEALLAVPPPLPSHSVGAGEKMIRVRSRVVHLRAGVVSRAEAAAPRGGEGVARARGEGWRGWVRLGVGLGVVVLTLGVLAVVGVISLFSGHGTVDKLTGATGGHAPVRVVVPDPPELRGVTPLAVLADKWLAAAETRMKPEQVESIRRMLEEADSKWVEEQAKAAAARGAGDVMPELSGIGSGVRVLVVRQADVLRGSRAERITLLSHRLEKHGFEVWDKDSLDDPVNTRAAVGGMMARVGPVFKGGEADIEVMKEWMDEEGEDVVRPEMVVWMVGTSGPSRVKAWIIPSDRCPEQAAKAAELLLNERPSAAPPRYNEP